MARSAQIERVEVKAYAVSTEQPESDGTYRWDATTLVVVHLHAAGARGIGYSYADPSAAALIRTKLAAVLMGRDALQVAACTAALVASLRNLGADGIGMLAVSALDNALWDLKAKLLDLPLVELLGRMRDAVPVYGSGGFTSYTIEELQRQLAGWVGQGIPRVKMKVGREPRKDVGRVKAARAAIGDAPELYIDANGAYGVKEALAMAQAAQEDEVVWFEEPVVHLDREGLRFLRERFPAAMEISVGEYGFTLGYFQDLLQAGAVDVMQADVTRCGISGFLQVATLCEAHHIPLSSHCAPAQHLHVCCAAQGVRHLEYFHDHVRIENMLFEGVVQPVNGALSPDLSRPGIGIELREGEAKHFEL